MTYVHMPFIQNFFLITYIWIIIITGEFVGFIGQNQQTASTAKHGHRATHALVFMVGGLTADIKMSLGYFPTATATADQLLPCLWEAIGLLETVCGLKVSKIIRLLVSLVKLLQGYLYDILRSQGPITCLIYIFILQVIASTSDKRKSKPETDSSTYRQWLQTPNLYAPNRSLYFISDAPHLVKTVRNNRSSSGFGKNTKRLWVRLEWLLQFTNTW